ncbi:MAG: 2-amino-4-hydroxy-6-hydroxymethyldihydropteridine diphosphokinase [bacterium]
MNAIAYEAIAYEAIAYIGLGSNISAELNLPAASALLAQSPGIVLKRVSPVYRTPPWGYADQESFLNAVAAVETTLPPLGLLDALQAVELRLDRKRAFPNGPRTADLDLLLYGETLIESKRLIVPHPRMHERGFVLVPLCDLAPQLTHPRLNRTMAELMESLDLRGIHREALALA